MISLVKKLIPLFAVILFFSSCYYDNLEELHPNLDGPCDTTGTIGYTADVLPILQSYCGINNDCHNADPNNQSSISLATYDGVRGNANSIVRSIKHDPSIAATRWMPSGEGMLNQCNIMKIEAWVNRGRLNN